MQSSNARQLHTEDDHIHARPRPKRRTVPKHRPPPKPVSRRRSKKKKKPMYDQVIKGSKNMPSIMRRGNIYFLVENEASQYRMPKAIIATVALIFVCAMTIVLAHAQITGMERQVAQLERDRRAVGEHQLSLDSMLIAQYSLEQIEYLATTRLGMIHPDPSQIIEIYVPPQNRVQLNRSDEFIPQENYFWNDIRTFASGLLNRVFGGN